MVDSVTRLPNGTASYVRPPTRRPIFDDSTYLAVDTVTIERQVVNGGPRRRYPCEKG